MLTPEVVSDIKLLYAIIKGEVGVHSVSAGKAKGDARATLGPVVTKLI
jgi:hypothetical protein